MSTCQEENGWIWDKLDCALNLPCRGQVGDVVELGDAGDNDLGDTAHEERGEGGSNLTAKMIKAIMKEKIIELWLN